MQKISGPPKWYQRFDKWSGRLMIGLFVVGLLFVLVDVGLIAAIVLQNRGLELAWLFTPKPTPVIEPAMWISPEVGKPGTVISVTGRGWQAHDPLVVQLEDPWGAACPAEIVATISAGQDGRLSALVIYPSSGCWSGLSRVQIAVRSLQTGKQAFAGFQMPAAMHTPTPTSVVEPTVTPTLPPASATPSPTVEPTSTLIPPPATPVPTTAPTSTPTATPTPTPVPVIVDWRGEYFDNVSLVGDARVVRNDGPTGVGHGTLGIGFDWGSGAPAAGLPADGFSARWTRALNFEQGRYRFYATVDDGMRLFVDGDLVIDEWRDGSQRQVAAERWMTAGRHALRVEYQATLIIADNDEPLPLPQVQFSAGTYNVAEGGQATITVLLSGAHDRPVAVDYVTADGTASNGSDYASANGRLTFEPGVTSRTFTVSTIEDAQDEVDETVVLALSNPGGATLGTLYLATLTIADNDEPLPVPQVGFSADTYSVDEGAETVTIAVQLSSAYDRPVTVGYDTAGGTAEVGSDYETIQGTLIYEPGVTEQTIAVHILDDQQDEEEETIVLKLTDAVNAVLGDLWQATLVIVDNDTVVSSSLRVRSSPLRR